MKSCTILFLLWIGIQFVHAQSELAGALLLEERFSEALALTDSLLQVDSSKAELYLFKGTALRGLGKYPEAIRSLKQAYQGSNQVSTALLIAGLQQESGNIPAAIEAFKQVLIADSLNARALFALGKIYLSEGQPRKALECFSPIYQCDTANAICTRCMAESYDYLDENDSAILFFRKAVQLNPEDRNSVFRLGNLYVRKNEFQAGISLTTTYLSLAALNEKPIDVKILKLNAYLYLLAFHPRMSIERFQQCLQLGDSSAFSFKYLGLGLHDISNYDSAVFYLHKARILTPSDPEVFFFLGKCYGMMNQPDTAIACLQKTIELLNPSPSFISSIQLMIADNHNLLKETDKALNALYTAKEFAVSPEVLFMLGRQFDFFASDVDSARQYYTRFLKMVEEQESQTREQHEYMDRARERLKKFQEDRFWLGLDSIPNK